MFFNCFDCHKVSPSSTDNIGALCPICGSKNGESVSKERFDDAYNAGAFFDIDNRGQTTVSLLTRSGNPGLSLRYPHKIFLSISWMRRPQIPSIDPEPKYPLTYGFVAQIRGDTSGSVHDCFLSLITSLITSASDPLADPEHPS
jgi:hypothetical protein